MEINYDHLSIPFGDFMAGSSNNVELTGFPICGKGKQAPITTCSAIACKMTAAKTPLKPVPDSDSDSDSDNNEDNAPKASQKPLAPVQSSPSKASSATSSLTIGGQYYHDKHGVVIVNTLTSHWINVSIVATGKKTNVRAKQLTAIEAFSSSSPSGKKRKLPFSNDKSMKKFKAISFLSTVTEQLNKFEQELQIAEELVRETQTAFMQAKKALTVKKNKQKMAKKELKAIANEAELLKQRMDKIVANC